MWTERMPVAGATHVGSLSGTNRGSASGTRQARFCLCPAPAGVLPRARTKLVYTTDIYIYIYQCRARANPDLALGAMCMISLLCINDSVRGIRVGFLGDQSRFCLGRVPVRVLPGAGGN